MIRYLRSLVVVVVLVILSSIGLAGQAKDRVIAEVGSVREFKVNVFKTNTLDGVSVASFDFAEKVVVLSRSREIARILLSDGSEVFALLAGLEISAPVTLLGAMSRVTYFEKQATKDALNSGYWEKLGAPWVALVARELASNPNAATLPPPTATDEETDTAPSLKVINNTKYSLRLYLTGNRTVSKTIAPGSSWKSEFPSGSYRVVAESTTGNVIPLKTTWKLDKGHRHEITLYIKSTSR